MRLDPADVHRDDVAEAFTGTADPQPRLGGLLGDRGALVVGEQVELGQSYGLGLMAPCDLVASWPILFEVEGARYAQGRVPTML